MDSLKNYNFKPIDLIIGGAITGTCYETLAYCYRHDKFKSVFQFIKKYPGGSIASISCFTGLALIYKKSLKMSFQNRTSSQN